MVAAVVGRRPGLEAEEKENDQVSAGEQVV